MVRKFVFIALAFFASLLPAASQWTQTVGPAGGEVSSIVTRNGILFAGTQTAGVQRSKDGGLTWSAANSGLSATEIHEILVEGSTLYAATSIGIFRSSNDGDNWVELTGQLTGQDCWTIATDFSRLFVGTRSGSFFISSNNGGSWVEQGYDSLKTWIKRIRVSGNDMYIGTWGEGIFRSTNAGQSWARIRAGITSKFIWDIDILPNSDLLASAWNINGIFRSTNKGTNWAKVPNLPDWEVRTLVVLGSTVYGCGYFEGLYWSDDSGITWSYGGLSGTNCFALCLFGSKLFVGTGAHRIAVADTGFVQNYKPALPLNPLNGATAVSTRPTFSWTPYNFTPPFGVGVRVELSTSPTIWTSAYVSSLTPGNSYLLDTTLARGKQYYWRIVDYTGTSDIFSFTTASDLIVTYPNGNEKFVPGDNINVTWQGVTAADTIRLEYSTNGGKVWYLISNKAVGLSHPWTIPRHESSKCLVRAKKVMSVTGGTIDPSFDVGGGNGGFDSGVECAVAQPDGKIILGGDFTMYQGRSARGMVRINNDGSYDTTFGIGAGFDATVRSVALQSDGKMIVVGDFTRVQNFDRSRIVRLQSDGVIDTTYNVGPGFNLGASSVALQSDQRAIVIGSFNQYNGNSHNRIARINTNGSGDWGGFQSGSGFDRDATSMMVQSDDKIVASGLCTNYNGSTKGFMFRMFKDGQVDSNFNKGIGFDRWTDFRYIDSDGLIYACGQFENFNSRPAKNIARLFPDGTADTMFVSQVDVTSGVSGLMPFSNGKILLYGSIVSYGGVSGGTHFVYPDGSRDIDFDISSGFNGPARFIKQDELKVIAFGQFTDYNGSVANRLIRILIENTDQILDTSDAVFEIGIPRGAAATVDFGDVEVKKSSSLDIILRNTGTVPLEIVGVVNASNNDFSKIIPGGIPPIPVGGTAQIALRFDPDSVGSQVDSIGFVTRLGDTIWVVVRGNAIPASAGVKIVLTVSDVSLCFSKDTILTVQATNGKKPYTFTWKLSDGSNIPLSEILSQSSNGDSLRVLPAQSRQYRVIVTDSSLGRDSALITLTSLPLPTPVITVTGSTALCQGDSVRLQLANAANFTGTVQWSNGDTGPGIFVKQAGSYKVTADSNGCSGTSLDVVITVTQKPKPVVSQAGDSVNCDISGAVYQWLDSTNTPVAGATNKSFRPAADGKYRVSVTDSNCTGVSSLFTFSRSQPGGKVVVGFCDFGNQPVNAIINQHGGHRKSVKVWNKTSAAVTIDSLNIVGNVPEFKVVPNQLPRDIIAGDSTLIALAFLPTLPQVYTAQLSAHYANNVEFGTVRGVGVDTIVSVTVIELVPAPREVEPGETLMVYMRIKQELPAKSSATLYTSTIDYDKRVLEYLASDYVRPLPSPAQRDRRLLQMEGFRGTSDTLITMRFIAKLSDVDSTSLLFNGDEPFYWSNANGKVYPAYSDSVVYIRVCTDGGKRLITKSPGTSVLMVSPNPGRGEVEVEYSLGERGHAEIYVCDVYGRHVAELANNETEIGLHRTTFDSSNWHEGTYVFVIRTSYALITEKIVILR